MTAAKAPGSSAEPDSPDAIRRATAAALERLAREQLPRLLGLARRLLFAEEEARAAVREAFAEASRQGPLDRPDAPERLESATVRAALLRARRLNPVETKIEALLPRFIEDGHHERHPPDWSDLGANRGEALRAARDAVRWLPPDEREALVLRDVTGLDDDTAARHLGVDPEELKRRLQRARRAVRGLLEAPLRRGDL